MLRPRFVGPAIGALSFACAIVLPLGSHAQTSAIVAPGFVSKPVLVSPITGDETKEIVVIAVTIAPGASSPAHTHPGDCIVTVSEGLSSFVSRARNRAVWRRETHSSTRAARFISSRTSVRRLLT